jgi:hypothetical protein
MSVQRAKTSDVCFAGELRQAIDWCDLLRLCHDWHAREEREISISEYVEKGRDVRRRERRRLRSAVSVGMWLTVRVTGCLVCLCSEAVA